MSHRQLFVVAIGVVAGCADISDDDPDVETSEQAVVLPNVCGNNATVPQLLSSAVTAPTVIGTVGSTPTLGRIERTDAGGAKIEYIAGSNAQLDIHLDGCTFISQVKLGSHVVPTTSVGGFRYVTTDLQSSPSQHELTLSVDFPPIHDGSTDDLKVTFARAGNPSLTTTYSLPIVHANQVFAAGQSSTWAVKIGTTSSGLFDRFSDGFYYSGNPVHNLSLGIVHGDAVRFSFGMDFECVLPLIGDIGQRHADVTGWFTPTLDPANHVVATSHVHADVSGCPGAGSTVASSISTKLDQNLADSFHKLNNSPGTRVLPVLNDNELVVGLQIPADTAEFEIPYDPFATSRLGTRFLANETVTLFASGIGMQDTSIVTPTFPVFGGPDGVRWLAPVHDTSAVHRNPDLLIDRVSYVGRLLGQTSTGPVSFKYWRYTAGCSITGSTKFGVNDTITDAQRTTNPGMTYHLYTMFVDGGTACDLRPADTTIP